MADNSKAAGTSVSHRDMASAIRALAMDAVEAAKSVVRRSNTTIAALMVHLGDAEDPSTGRREQNLPMARQTIDLLGLLQDKTRGNLDGGEERVLEQALIDLRLRFVEVSKQQG